MAERNNGRSRFFRDDENFKANKCSLCGSCDAEDYVYADGYTICEQCTEQLDLSDILDLFGYESTSELIEALCGEDEEI
jgi:hypothetical protein